MVRDSFRNRSKTNRTLIFRLTLYWGLLSACAAAVCNCTPNVSTLGNFQRVVLTRLTRSVIFPNKAFVLLTPAFTKAVLGGRPRGLSYSVEFDFYSPLPDTIEGWQPKILINQAHREQEPEKMKPQKAPEMASMTPNVAVPDATPPDYQYVNDSQPQFSFTGDDFPDYIDMGSMATGRADKRYHHRIDEEPYADDPSPFYQRRYDADWEMNHDHHGPLNLADFYAETFKKTKKYSSRKGNRIIDQFHKIPYYMAKSINEGKHRKSSQKKIPYKKANSNYEKWSSYGPPDEAYLTPEAVPQWKYHQGYRERRELFEQLEAVGKMFNFDMKACIQRIMCEITKQLRPYGESLMEDIVRILFTIPKDHNFEDDYSHVEDKLRNANCEKHFAISCPYRVLEFFKRSLQSRNHANVNL